MKQLVNQNKKWLILGLGLVVMSALSACSDDSTTSSGSSGNCADTTLTNDPSISVTALIADTVKIGETLHIKWTTDLDIVNDVQIFVSLNGGRRPYYPITLEGSIENTKPEWGDKAWAIPTKMADEYGDSTTIESACAVIIIKGYNQTEKSFSKRFTITK